MLDRMCAYTRFLIIRLNAVSASGGTDKGLCDWQGARDHSSWENLKTSSHKWSSRDSSLLVGGRTLRQKGQQNIVRIGVCQKPQPCSICRDTGAEGKEQADQCAGPAS